MTSIPIPIGDERIAYQGKILEVVQQDMDEGGKTKTYEFARRSPGTRLIIISPEKKILLTKEYRPELKTWDYRLPGGKVFDSLSEYNVSLKSGEDVVQSAIIGAKREAEEEAGIVVKNIVHFATSVCGATVRWDLFYFVVDQFEANPNQNLGEGENIQTNWFGFEEAKKLCLSGQVSEDRSVAVLLRYLLK